MDTSINNEKIYMFEGLPLSATELQEFKDKVQGKINTISSLLSSSAADSAYKTQLKTMLDKLKNLYNKLSNIEQ